MAFIDQHRAVYGAEPICKVTADRSIELLASRCSALQPRIALRTCKAR